MKSLNIKIIGIKDLTDFVTMASKEYGDVLVKRGKFCVDAKSLMGVMSIDISQGALVECTDDVSDNFLDFVAQFEV